jgi:hypothetical protein
MHSSCGHIICHLCVYRTPSLSSISKFIFLSCTRPAVISYAICVSIAPPLCHLSPRLSSCPCTRPAAICLFLCTCLFVGCVSIAPLFVMYRHIYLLAIHSSCGLYVYVCVLVCLRVYRTPSLSSISTSIFLSCTRPALICLCLCTCLFVYLSHPPLCHLSPHLSCLFM